MKPEKHIYSDIQKGTGLVAA